MGRRAGSSNPEPRPVVPRIIPRQWGRVLRWVIDWWIESGEADKGRVPKK